MQHEITSKQNLLDANGNIAEPGYAKKLYWKYSRDAIKAPKWRIKEWDYYYVGNDSYGLALTIADAGYISSLEVSVLTFGDNPTRRNKSALGLFPLGKLRLPASSERGDVHARVGNAEMTFTNNGAERRLKGAFHKFSDTGETLVFDIALTAIPKESMVIATPFDKPGHFYYNQKINCMRADGMVSIGGKEYHFESDKGAMGTLDWGRGVWTYDNTWYWGSGSMETDDGDRFGFNIGYGFGDTSAASENMLFFNGTAHKLGEVKFNIPVRDDGTYDYMKTWTFTESDGRFEMTFTPVMDRYDPVDLKVICMIPHQVFGRISGKAVLDDGTVINVHDKMVFAEHVHNKW